MKDKNAKTPRKRVLIKEDPPKDWGPPIYCARPLAPASCRCAACLGLEEAVVLRFN